MSVKCDGFASRRKMEIGSEQWKTLIQNGAKILGRSVPRQALSLFAIHAQELMCWNRTVNLTSITDPLDVAVKHYLDAIVPADILPPEASVLDIGSGGGFPGIPLKILIPTLSVTLIDASRKKVSFLKHVNRTLALDGIEVMQIRAEDLLHYSKAVDSGQHLSPKRNHRPVEMRNTKIQPAFDVIISRALSSLQRFISVALPLLQNDGMIIAMKGRLSDSELEQAQASLGDLLMGTEMQLNVCEMKVRRYRLPLLHAERAMVTVTVKH